jgi:hypothetical protein
MSEPAEGVSAPADVKHLKLDAIASIGSAVALLIFTLITVAHLRVRAETGANVLILVTAIAAAGVVLVTFVFTTLIHEPASIVALVVILATVPVIAPFLFIDDVNRAVRIANFVATGLLFMLGYRWAQHTGGRPIAVGLAVAAFGLMMVLVTVLLGG